MSLYLLLSRNVGQENLVNIFCSIQCLFKGKKKRNLFFLIYTSYEISNEQRIHFLILFGNKIETTITDSRLSRIQQTKMEGMFASLTERNKYKIPEFSPLSFFLT
jgi:hypothetical protein